MAYINTETMQYPVSERDIRNTFPNTSFSSPFNPPEEYQVVFSVPMPTFDSYTHTCREVQPQVSAKGHYEQVYELTERTLTQEETDVIVAQLKEQKLTLLANYRYTKETSGIDVGGTLIKTDRESQATLTGAWVTVQQNPSALIDWKADSGWTQIDKATVEALSMAVASHVQSCFSKEKLHYNAVTALTTIVDVQEYDYTEGW